MPAHHGIPSKPQKTLSGSSLLLRSLSSTQVLKSVVGSRVGEETITDFLWDVGVKGHWQAHRAQQIHDNYIPWCYRSYRFAQQRKRLIQGDLHHDQTVLSWRVLTRNKQKTARTKHFHKSFGSLKELVSVNTVGGIDIGIRTRKSVKEGHDGKTQMSKMALRTQAIYIYSICGQWNITESPSNWGQSRAKRRLIPHFSTFIMLDPPPDNNFWLALSVSIITNLIQVRLFVWAEFNLLNTVLKSQSSAAIVIRTCYTTEITYTEWYHISNWTPKKCISEAIMGCCFQLISSG